LKSRSLNSSIKDFSIINSGVQDKDSDEILSEILINDDHIINDLFNFDKNSITVNC